MVLLSHCLIPSVSVWGGEGPTRGAQRHRANCKVGRDNGLGRRVLTYGAPNFCNASYNTTQATNPPPVCWLSTPLRKGGAQDAEGGPGFGKRWHEREPRGGNSGPEGSQRATEGLCAPAGTQDSPSLEAGLGEEAGGPCCLPQQRGQGRNHRAASSPSFAGGVSAS